MRWLLLLALGCGGSYVELDIPPTLAALPEPELQETPSRPAVEAPLVAPAEQLFPEDRPGLRVWPEASLRDDTEDAVALLQSLGVNIEIAVGGMPLNPALKLGSEKNPLAGQALNDHWCGGDSCNNPATGARIWILNEYHGRWLVIAHELGHVLSGWGKCKAAPKGLDREGHLSVEGHVMSQNIVHDTAVEDELDRALLCSCGVCS